MKPYPVEQGLLQLPWQCTIQVKPTSDNVKIVTPGGNLQVKFKSSENGYDQIWLTGPAQLVFKGEINVES